MANGINSGLFMVVPNRTGDEGSLSFYGSSFISDPYGRVLVQAPRDEEAVLVADLDLDQRRDWLGAVPVPVDPKAGQLRHADRAGRRGTALRGRARGDSRRQMTAPRIPLGVGSRW